MSLSTSALVYKYSIQKLVGPLLRALGHKLNASPWNCAPQLTRYQEQLASSLSWQLEYRTPPLRIKAEFSTFQKKKKVTCRWRPVQGPHWTF